MKSRRVGTLSLNINTDDFNYGALLHSYAFQKYLQKKQLCEYTEIVNYTTPKSENNIRNNNLKNAIKNHRKIKSIIKNIFIYSSYKSRYKKFESFINNNMTISKKHYTQNELDKSILNYDTIICESDVIWAPGFFGGNFDKTFFMNLNSMKNMKKIAYAPSMADGDLNDDQKKVMKYLLKDIDYISCRESYEKDILQEMTDKKVQHVIDPVLLLNEDDYEDIIGKRILKQKYLLLYLPVDNNKKLRKYARQYAKRNGLKLLEITTNCIKTMGGCKTITNAGIEEFLSAIKYADVIFTNSFHAICFSLIFRKQFYAFSRGSFGKVKDICQIMNIEERFFENDEFRELSNIDYKETEKILNKLRNNSEKWIDNALSN